MFYIEIIEAKDPGSEKSTGTFLKKKAAEFNMVDIKVG